MVSRAIARRYAKGLLQAATAQETDDDGLRALADELGRLAEVVADHGVLRAMLANPAVQPAKKAAVVLDIVERLEPSELGRRFVEVLGENDRLAHVVPIAEVFGEMVDESMGVITAEITTPADLGEEAGSRLREQLAEATGRTVRVTTRTDPGLLGGLVTRIGDIVYDGSVRHHLERVHEQIVKD